MVGTVKAKVLIIPDNFRNFDYTKMITSLRPKWPHLEHVFVIGDNHPSSMESIDYLFNTPWEAIKDPSILDEISLDPNDITEIIFTSWNYWKGKRSNAYT